MLNFILICARLSLLISINVYALNVNTEKLFLSQLQPQIKIPASYKKYYVNNVANTYQALKKIHKNGGFSAIIFSEGTYIFKHTLNISAPHVMFLSKSSNPIKTILRGNGMKPTSNVDNLIRVAADNFAIDGLTLEQAGNHLIQIAGEYGASNPIIRNSIFQDGYEQLLKVTYSNKLGGKSSLYGLVENCLFQYTKRVGPNFYIGGIDAHGIQNWRIKHNVFVNIASPAKRIAEHAIHLWRDTANNLIDSNIIINSDRGIGFGMKLSKSNFKKFSNYSGIIQNNVIYHANNHSPFADTGIILEDSPETTIKNNLIYFEHNYPNAIEYRFNNTVNALIIDNSTNKRIVSRNGGNATLLNNDLSDKTKGKLINKLHDFIIN